MLALFLLWLIRKPKYLRFGNLLVVVIPKIRIVKALQRRVSVSQLLPLNRPLTRVEVNAKRKVLRRDTPCLSCLLERSTWPGWSQCPCAKRTALARKTASFCDAELQIIRKPMPTG